MVRWIRSWVAGELPTDRPYVVDDLERLPIANWDYTPLGAIDDDVIIIEWDMALDVDQMAVFERYASLIGESTPLVAPYKLFHVAEEPVWAHRRVSWNMGEMTVSERWLRLREPTCDLFGFGLVYLPRSLVRQFLEAEPPERGRPPIALGGFFDKRFTDQTFSTWWTFHKAGRPVPVVWDVRPVHLHSKIAASERLG